MAFFPGEILKCVVYIAYKMADGTFRFAGTAFLIDRPAAIDLPQYGLGYVVTARHVIEGIRSTGLNEIFVCAKRKDGNVGFWQTNVEDWVFHQDPTCDLSATRLRIVSQIDHLSISPPLWRDSVSSADLEPAIGDEIYIAGFFSHQIMAGGLYPVLRIGNIAALRNESISTAMGLVDAYLVETRSFSGLSGSPVFRRASGFRAGTFVMCDPDFYLLGVIHGHFDIQSPNIGRERNAQQNHVNMGIGIVTPADKLAELMAQFDDLEKSEIEDLRAALPVWVDPSDLRFEFVKRAQGATLISRTRIIKKPEAISVSLMIGESRLEMIDASRLEMLGASGLLETHKKEDEPQK
jgi:hypothetical protein